MDAVRPDQEGLDEPFGNDDVAPAAHAELEQQREIREYARWVAWELPLLSKYARPFEPPKKTHPLRFRYTTYLGEDHPAARKVVVELDPNDLPNLSEQQRDKLIKIAGSRYHPGTGIIKMSSEAFGTQAQNKRFLGDTINGLIAEARDGKDTFEDVPFDFRYYTPKPFHEFPKEWIMTPERKQELEQRRIAQLEGFGESRGDAVPLLDGTSAAEKVEEPVMIRSRLRAREAPMERPSFMPRP
ncbi:hypothetical protein P152DRAFT_397680 [Eremomyces bilateralis CBS 781.70]|uniref:Small ribosomal subunit protein mS35 mitochondrial conserved domain-containing protein n=1 Tax=Eremomyces bilateralis CBS 781.70 TaxID=1392243 RepID=A0A6G1G2E5_9PEZI|nr:uncharacterized protein P152DRAFT_397680 [Eremomyces bilateralis CBS 781.70]KAF1812188.1 hypothetical protein P152DRAFT_397680 [Eremomyces bilateralis CBS 781.70]